MCRKEDMEVPTAKLFILVRESFGRMARTQDHMI